MRRPLSGANTRTLPSFHAGRERKLFSAATYSQRKKKISNAAASVGFEPYLPLRRTADDAVAIAHEVQGVAGHVGYRDAEQLFGFVYVPHPDILLRAGCK